MYAHLWHVDGEAGDVDYELILGPYEGVQLTYQYLRETENGDNIAVFAEGAWFPLVGENPAEYSDITFSDERPDRIVR